MSTPFPLQPIDETPAWPNLQGRTRLPEARQATTGSLYHALAGVRYAFATQRNIRIQAALGIIALSLGIVLRLPVHQFVLIFALTLLVLFAELMNTAIEATLDQHAGDSFDWSVKRIKDMAAAAVLIVSIAAATLGASIFLPALAKFSR